MRPSHGGEVWDYGKRPIDFSANINPLGPSKSALKAFDKKIIEYYPPAYPKKLKARLARYIGVRESNITIGNGSMPIIRDFCSLFLKKSDEVVIVEPTFSEYERYAEIYGGSVKKVLPEVSFKHSSKEIIDACGNSTSLIFICRPNNPTGWTIPKDELNAVLKYAENNGIFVFLDEAFIEFSMHKSLAKKVIEFKYLFVLRSFTKFFAIPGLRVGYGVSNAELIKRLEHVNPPWGVNIFAHDASLESLKDKSYIEKTKNLIQDEKRFLKRKIEELGVKVYESDSNFLLLSYNWNSKDVKQALLEDGLLIRDASTFYGLDTRFIRVSIRKRAENKRLVLALKKQVESGIKKGIECRYYPCHFEGQNCTYCFCPFYPCGDQKRGKLITGKKGKKVWTCKDCKDIHRPDVVEAIESSLGGKDIEKMDRKTLLKIKARTMNSP